ncbi:hypothetical protein CSB37_02310 [bacterium DOLZORAL124_38_8]|nr:MAG: hypothetical protein CSB37_02310 [bacterium DOLZORAL124_38_8]
MFKLIVTVNLKRPDFRVFGSYFFGDDFYNYDSEGDAFPVTSKDWTELYMCSRQNNNLFFEIIKIKDKPLLFEIESCNEENVYRVAYFLARETNGFVKKENGDDIILESMFNKMGDFNLQERLKIADSSIWRKASEENPYPNLELK